MAPSKTLTRKELLGFKELTIMVRESKGKQASKFYERLVDIEKTPKGYVPVLVGRGPLVERIDVNVKLFNDPCMVALLEMAEDELGDRREGVLRITCDVDHFRRVIGVISKSRI